MVTSGSVAGGGGSRASTYDPATYTAETFDVEGYTPTERGYREYTAQQAERTELEVTPDQLVENRLQGLLSKGNPLLTLRETQARQRMAERGLVSSSMATGEALRATTETALPIAAADAATYANTARFNAEMANVLAQFNVSQINAAEAFNAGSANQAMADNQRVVNSANEFLANARNAAKSQNTMALNQAAQFAAEAANQARAAAALAENNFRAIEMQAASAGSIAAMQEAGAMARQIFAAGERAKEIAFMAETDARRFEAEALNRRSEQERLIQADKDLFEMRQRTDVSSQGMSIFQSTMDNITRIMGDPNLEPASKQAAVDQQKANLDTSLRFLSQVNQIEGLNQLLTFSAPSFGAPANTVAPQPQPGQVDLTGTTQAPFLPGTFTTEFSQEGTAPGFTAPGAIR
jgi:hypothetical protein